MQTITQKVKLEKIIKYWTDQYKAEGKILSTSWGINPITNEVLIELLVSDKEHE